MFNMFNHQSQYAQSLIRVDPIDILQFAPFGSFA